MPIRLDISFFFFFFFFLLNKFLKHAIDMTSESFIFFTITYEINSFKC